MSNGKGELHRIYWQQWVSSSEKKSRRELITSSAGIRISHSGAKAKDVTQLLRATLKLGKQEIHDNLVLVGTLYSLPRDYVQFEHEEETRLSLSSETPHSSSSTSTSETAETAPLVSSYPKTDPYHIVKTLQPDDDPLEVKRRMEERLKQLQKEAPVTRTIISPKLQWFFIPSSNEKDSLIPNCVELDGYCTSLEDEDDGRSGDDDDSSFDDEEQNTSMEDDTSTENDSDDSNYRSQLLCSYSSSKIDDRILRRFPWLQNTEHEPSPNHACNDNELHIDASVLHKSSKERKRRQLFHKQQNMTVKAQSFAGYLTKQSQKDANVWRKCYCVITDNHMWYISRIYGKSRGQRKIRYSKHGRIRLTNALLLEPSPDYTPLFRTPFAFELVTGNGKSHVFRATGKTLQTKWIQTLSNRIIQSYENSFLDNAELIVADETLARTRRMESLAADPFWKAIVESRNSVSLDATVTRMRGHTGAVLRWGMQVAAFKERCRQIQRSLPAKSPIVVATDDRPSRQIAPNASESVDPVVVTMMETSWTRAAELLARATHVATQLQPRLSHSIETQCRHIDYMIHGRFRTTSFEDASRSSLGDHPRLHDADTNDTISHRGAPPIDLFDQLLKDLQILAAANVAMTSKEKNGEQRLANGEFDSKST